MAADTQVTTTWPAGHPPISVEKGYFEIYGQYAVPAGNVLEINDIIKLLPLLPKNMRITRFTVASDDLDSNGTPLVTLTGRVTDGATTKNAFVASTVAQAGGVQDADEESIMGYVIPNRSFRAEVLCAAAPATGAAGTIRIIVGGTMAIPGGEMS